MNTLTQTERLKKRLSSTSLQTASAFALSLVIFAAINISIFLLDFRCLNLGQDYKLLGDVALLSVVIKFCAGQFWIVRIVSLIALMVKNNWKKYALYAVLVFALVAISQMLLFIDTNYVALK